MTNMLTRIVKNLTVAGEKARTREMRDVKIIELARSLSDAPDKAERESDEYLLFTLLAAKFSEKAFSQMIEDDGEAPLN